MTAQSAIHELKQVRQYCSARAIPAIDYAIQVLQGLAEREKRVEEAKQANPQSPQDPAEDFPNDQQVQDAILQWWQWSYYHLRYKEIP